MSQKAHDLSMYLELLELTRTWASRGLRRGTSCPRTESVQLFISCQTNQVLCRTIWIWTPRARRSGEYLVRPVSNYTNTTMCARFEQNERDYFRLKSISSFSNNYLCETCRMSPRVSAFAPKPCEGNKRYNGNNNTLAPVTLRSRWNVGLG